MALSEEEMAALLAAPRPEPPPSILPALAEALINYSANSARSLQKRVGPSEIGIACQRRLAYKILETPEMPDRRVPWRSLVGTGVHHIIAEALKNHPDWLVEQHVDPSRVGDLAGTLDAFHIPTATVIDWKAPGKTTVDAARPFTPKTNKPRVQKIKRQYLIQPHPYGRGLELLGYRPQWVRIVFLNVAGDFWDSPQYVEPYKPQVAFEALDRLYTTLELAKSKGAAAVPAYPDPDDCTYCPFRRLGPVSETGCPGVEAGMRKQSGVMPA